MNYISLEEAKNLIRPWSMKSERICEYCLGTGIVNKDVIDGDSHQWMKGVKETPCVCQLDN